MPNLVEKPGNLGSLEVAFEVNWKLMSTCGIAVLSTLCTLYCLMISFIDLVQQASNLKLNSKSRDFFFFFTIMTFFHMIWLFSSSNKSIESPDGSAKVDWSPLALIRFLTIFTTLLNKVGKSCKSKRIDQTD